MARAPFVAVRTDIRKEERVLVIADIAGYSRHEALGRLIDMWSWCTDRGLDDAPDDCEGYAVSDAVVRRFMGLRGVEALLGNDCDELALGSRRSDGLIYLRGTSDTVSRLRALRSSASAGGRARSEVSQSKGRDGRFVGKRTKAPAGRVPSTSQTGAVNQPASSQPPASSSEIPDPRSQIPDPIEELSLSPQTAPRPREQSAHARVVAAFDAHYAERNGCKPTWDAKRGRMVSDLLKKQHPDELIRRIVVLFTDPPSFLSGCSADLATFVQHIDKLAKPSRTNGARSRDPTVGQVEPEHHTAYPDGELPFE